MMGGHNSNNEVDEEAALNEATTTTLGSISKFFGRSASSEGDDSVPELNVIKLPLLNRDHLSNMSTGSLSSYETFDTEGIRPPIRFQVVSRRIARVLAIV